MRWTAGTFPSSLRREFLRISVSRGDASLLQELYRGKKPQKHLTPSAAKPGSSSHRRVRLKLKDATGAELHLYETSRRFLMLPETDAMQPSPLYLPSLVSHPLGSSRPTGLTTAPAGCLWLCRMSVSSMNASLPFQRS